MQWRQTNDFVETVLNVALIWLFDNEQGDLYHLSQSSTVPLLRMACSHPWRTCRRYWAKARSADQRRAETRSGARSATPPVDAQTLGCG